MQEFFLRSEIFLVKAEEFIVKLTDIMDTETKLTLETKLSDVEEWDSLSAVSFFSFCNSKLGKNIDVEQLKAAETVKDLYKFVEEV